MSPCEACGHEVPTRIPRHLQWALFGGWVCGGCGSVVNHEGRALLHEEDREDGRRFSVPGGFEVWQLAAAIGALLPLLLSLGFLAATWDLRGGPYYNAPVGYAELALFASMGAVTALLWLGQSRIDSRWMEIGPTSVRTAKRTLHYAHVERVEPNPLAVVMQDGSRHALPVGGPTAAGALGQAVEAFRTAQEAAEPVPEQHRRALERARER